MNIVDANGRTVGEVGGEDDKEGRIYHQLNQTMSFYEPFLHWVLEKIKEQFKLTEDDLVECLHGCPVFLESRKTILREGLSAYMAGDFLKAIHVLVPQVEEILRNLLVMMGISPVKPVPRHPGISDVKSMNNVLEDVDVRRMFPEDVWRYLTLLFIERRGMNLRNDLAHGLIPIEGFNQGVANRVVHSLLVLSLVQGKSRENI